MSKYYYAILNKYGKLCEDYSHGTRKAHPAIYTKKYIAEQHCADDIGETIKRILISDLTKLLKK